MTPARALRLLARNLRRLRGETSVERAAAASEMHWRLWQKVETGRHNPTLATLTRMAAGLRVELHELFAMTLAPVVATGRRCKAIASPYKRQRRSRAGEGHVS